MQPRVRCRDESLEQRMRLGRFTEKFGMKLARHKKRMVLQFDDLHQFAIRREAAEYEAGFLKFIAISVIEFVTVAMPLVDHEGAVQFRGGRAKCKLASLRAQSHRAALFGHLLLAIEKGDHWTRRINIEFG